jgi:LuxR family transcriptional regulator, maltose regulon positive regulatory protein
MQETLLRTKLFMPPTRPNLVPRPRLLDQIEQGLHLGHKLTLISAPAGFGKTTLITDFGLRIGERQGNKTKTQNPAMSWLSLDEGDNDPTLFLTYLVVALRTLAPEIGKRALAALQSPMPPPPGPILTFLLNEIIAVPNQLVLVLDDYHLIDAQVIDDALSFLLDNLPPNMHLVIATREDPNLPLARLRVRGQLTEIRVADLRFTADEAAEFLNQMMDLDLSVEEVTALERRTEGWIAGLQMAALSMRGRSDTAEFIQAFTGTHHFVLDYLLEEVLSRQPENVQTFLLRSAILDRFCGPLCDAVRFNKTPSSSVATAVEDRVLSGQETLEYLESANLFLVPLDDERRWYRYHHLFADLLRQRLQRQFPDSLAELHGRASIWYEENGLDIEAFQHAAAANDIERAARLLEGQGMPLHYRGAMIPVINWLASLDASLLDANPSLWVTYATALTMSGRANSEVEKVLGAAEAALQNTAEDDQSSDLLGQIASIRAMSAIPQYRQEEIMRQSRLALELLNPDNQPARTAATWTLGLAYQRQGDRAAASRAFSEAIAIGEASGNVMFIIAAATSLGQVQEAENQLALAAESYRRVLDLAGDPPLPAATEAYFGLARIQYEWNDLAAAQEHAQQALQLARQMENVDTPAACMAFLARLKLAAGDTAGAAKLLSEAEQFIRRRSLAAHLPEIFASRVLLLLNQGDPAAAAELAQKNELTLSLARVHLAQGKPSAALALLDSWRQEVEDIDRPDERLKRMVLQAVVLGATGQEDKALQMLAETLAMAETGGFIRTFVDEGPPMAQLLREANTHGITPAYTSKLLNKFPITHSELQFPNSQKSEIFEPLSPRELEVLQLIAQGLSNREIGERLFLALDTVKGHNRNIFSKLGVKNRTEAVSRARELDLL